MDIKELSLKMAKRLKDEREAKKLSHAGLSDALYEKYGVRIAKDSLINYEVSSEHHTKSFKNNGMRIEYLRYLADFYEVSADWLLGISDTRTRNAEVSQIGESTGLNPQAVENIIALKDLHPDIETYNCLLRDLFKKKSLLAHIANYLTYFTLEKYKEAPYKYIPVTQGSLFPHMPDVLLASVIRHLEKSRTQFEKEYRDNEEFMENAILGFLLRHADYDECRRYIDNREYERAVEEERRRNILNDEDIQDHDGGHTLEPEEEAMMEAFNEQIQRENEEENEKEKAIRDFLARAGQ